MEVNNPSDFQHNLSLAAYNVFGKYICLYQNTAL